MTLAPAASFAGVADAQNPAPINTFELDAGRRFDHTPGGQTDSYYRLTYKGDLVRAQGTPFKFSSGLDLTAPATDQSTEGTGDRNKWSLSYENRSATLGGSMLEANGVQPLVLAGIEKLDLRGTASVASGDKGTYLALGLETPPFRLPGLAGREVTNWIVFGVNAQRNPGTAAAASTDRSLLTYRAFVGKAFGWHKSANVHKTADRIEQDILKQASTLDEAKVLAKKIRMAAKNGAVSNLQSLLLDASDLAETDQDWQKAVQTAAAGEADAITDQPTMAVYAESTGWYTANHTVDGQRFRNLLTLTLDYWFVPGRDDVFIRLRYEDGHEWTSPQIRRQQLFATLALRF